ncbi:hypothetical protein [Parasedimentitalea marina]|uniref:hypothetical protein n=1 Tax=Parasedimentitalea marina TaxID=2483033 RepID=UPI000FD99B22|nr:hypothetical protein [Parasedimentitalea marina]
MNDAGTSAYFETSRWHGVKSTSRNCFLSSFLQDLENVETETTENGKGVISAFEYPLFPHASPNVGEEFWGFLSWPQLAFEEQKNWFFWHKWYQGFLDGKPLDWELQRQVALIADTIWEAGLTAVAEEIEKICAKLVLERRIDELEADLRCATVNRHGIGGSRPPEMLDDAPIAQELAIVWQPLKDLKDEITKDDPDREHLQKNIEALVAALKKGFAWCLKKGDLIVDTAIKWAIPSTGTGYLALNPQKLEAVIEAAKKLFGLL